MAQNILKLKNISRRIVRSGEGLNLVEKDIELTVSNLLNYTRNADNLEYFKAQDMTERQFHKNVIYIIGGGAVLNLLEPVELSSVSAPYFSISIELRRKLVSESKKIIRKVAALYSPGKVDRKNHIEDLEESLFILSNVLSPQIMTFYRKALKLK